MIQDQHVWWTRESVSRAPLRVLEALRDVVPGLSPRKIVRLAILLTLAILCWVAVGWIALKLVEFAKYGSHLQRAVSGL